MKMFKRLLAVALVLVMVLSLSACIHKKDEIAVTVGDEKFTSAYYMCALITAETEAKQKVQEGELTEEEQQGNIDYYSKKIDDKNYVTWVEDRAVEMIKEIAAYRTLCKNNKIELTDEQKSEAEEVTDYYWDSYGYSQYFEPNGVGKETYKKFTLDSYYAEEYFQYVYGEEGTKALTKKDVEKEITDNYILVDRVSSSYTDDQTDDQKKAMKKLLQKEADLIKDGEKTFEEVYKQYNDVSDEEEEHDHDEETVEPKNKYAQIIGSEDTSYASTDYDTFKKYKVGTPKVIELEDGSGCELVIKRNIKKDQYYMDMLDAYARHALADEDFEKEISEFAKTLKLDVNKYATKQFKVKEIIVPETTY